MTHEPRLEACYFDAEGERSFSRMARVLEVTAAEHCGAWQRSVVAIPRPSFGTPTGVPAHVHNTQKLDHWVKVVQDAADGVPLLLLDGDMAIVRPLDDVWSRDFDLAYTTKAQPFPFNLGVVFLRVSDRIRAFFLRWQEQNRALLQAPAKARTWRRQYGGVNQAAFGQLLEAGALADLTIVTLPCEEWNCEESAWATFDPAVTRILHLKGALRRSIFGRERVTPERAAAVTWWRQIHDELVQTRRTA